MEFKLTEEEVREFARLEEDAGCDVEAGFDWGANLGSYLAHATCTIDHGKLLEILRESLGNVLSQEELEEAANSFQEQLRSRVIEKFQSAKSA